MQPGKLHILHTNDIHSHFENMPHIAGGIQQLKARCKNLGEEVVIVDLGDHSDRMSSITEGTWGHANVEIMNATGYQFAAIGNNEGLTFPKEKFLSLYDSADFRIICCNLIDRATGEIPTFIEPYIIQEMESLRIGWISATAPFPVYELLGWEILDPLEQIDRIVKEIRDQTDLIIVLSHTGYKNDRVMAGQIEGIDVIIGAHTHDLIETGVWVDQTFIIQAGKFGQYLGQTTIEFDKLTKQMISVNGKCHEVNGFVKDQQIEALIREKQKEADQSLSPFITELPYPLPIDWKQESPLGNLLAKGIRDWVDSDISMVNAGQLLFSLPRGRVTKKDILSLCPHPINPCKVLIKGKYIKQILEESLEDTSIHRQVRGLGFRGKVLGWMCVDGLSICYNPNQKVGQRIIEMKVNGNSFENEQIYSVGTVDMFTFGWIFPFFSEAEEVEYFLPEFIRDVLAKELQSRDAIERSLRKKWTRVN